MTSPEEQLKALGIELPVPVQPVANYITNLQVNNLLYLSGHAFSGEPTPVDIGKLGRELTVEQGYQAARNAGVCVLATIKEALGDLNRVKRIVRVLGMVNSTEDFADHPKVINGFSDLMVEVFGEKGKHVRSAVGMGSLPGGIAVEIEVTLEVEA
ncbi:RidA family protein [Pontibacter korlensis]|uniref:Endoribonuclease L-PSP n=1 Tax=Pontibacter korlensis TaxID=400092 RepID=A0A0E3ZI85_9BACT|nr:RidA family protein [Pontibacter korlensis]AKD04944.1 endoribonuclease L-PSP [Pontibacter korlensis]